MTKDEMPESLISHINDHIYDGDEIFTTHGGDGDEIIWIIPIPSLGNWFQLVSWFAGSEEWHCMNIEGKATRRLYEVLTEFGIGDR